MAPSGVRQGATGCEGVREGAKIQNGTIFGLSRPFESAILPGLRAGSRGEKEIDNGQIITQSRGILARRTDTLKLRVDTARPALAAHRSQSDSSRLEKRMANQ